MAKQDEISKRSLESLFRTEAIDHRRSSWLGDILLAQSYSNWALAFLFAAMVAATIIFCAWGEYTKKARASGYVVPERGLLKIYPQQSGSIVDVHLKEGASVKKGDVLAIISIERNGVRGATQVEIEKQLSMRLRSLEVEKDKTHLLYAEQQQSAIKRLERMQQEREEIDRAITAQEERISISQKVENRYARLFKENFVSEMMLQEKRSDLIDQTNRLRDLQRAKIVSDRDSIALGADLRNLPIKERNEVAALERAIGEITATGLDNEAHREVFVLAPQDGVITAVQVDLGKQANPQQPLASLIPAGTRLMVDLYVPSRAVGFIRVGNEARLQYQAYPYQKFGSQVGSVVRVSRTSVPAQELPFPAPSTDAYYVVTVYPEKDHVTAYGKPEPLQTGMQVDADIWLDRRTLFEWILEPLYSVTGRV